VIMSEHRSNVEERSSRQGQRVLVAGIGNIFLGDDGFGTEVAQRLGARPQPDGVKVTDFGIRGLHLALELMEGYDLVVLVDAVRRGDPPGTVSVIEPDTSDLGGEASPDAHDMDPVTVLRLLDDMGGEIDQLLLVAGEVAETDEQIGLSVPMAAAVDEAVRVVENLVAEHVSTLTVKES